MSTPTTTEARKINAGQIQLIASGDLRLSANQMCWPAQAEMETQLNQAIENLGFTVVRAHDVLSAGGGVARCSRHVRVDAADALR